MDFNYCISRMELSVKKKIAAASRYSQEAFAWVSEVENATKFEELEDSGTESWQIQLDTKISAEIDKILSGEFRKQVQIQETALSNSGKMIKGRQVLWLIYRHFKLSDEDGAMLEWDELVNVHLKGKDCRCISILSRSFCLGI